MALRSAHRRAYRWASASTLLELRKLVDCAELIVRSGVSRHESRGLHCSRDWPVTFPSGLPTIELGKPRQRQR